MTTVIKKKFLVTIATILTVIFLCTSIFAASPNDNPPQDNLVEQNGENNDISSDKFQLIQKIIDEKDIITLEELSSLEFSDLLDYAKVNNIEVDEVLENFEEAYGDIFDKYKEALENENLDKDALEDFKEAYEDALEDLEDAYEDALEKYEEAEEDEDDKDDDEEEDDDDDDDEDDDSDDDDDDEDDDSDDDDDDDED